MKSLISFATSLQKVWVILCVISLTIGSLHPLAYVGAASARDAVVEQPVMETVYVSQQLFDMIAEWSESDASSANARSSVPLIDFVQSERPELADEVSELVHAKPTSVEKKAILGEISGEGAIGGETIEVIPPKGVKPTPQPTIVPAPTCSCQIIVPVANGDVTPFINSPSEHESNTEHYYKEMRNWPNRDHVKIEESFYTSSHGAFHSGDGYRYRFQGANDHTSSGMTNATELQFQMICINGAGNACEGCVGELELRAQYESTAKTRSDSAGSPFSNGARSGAGDGVMLTYDPPGAQEEMVLMNKGVGSSHVNRTTYNAEAFLNLVKNAVQITAAVLSADEGTVAAGNIEGDLMDETIANLLGLIERDGVQGTNVVNMRGVYDTADSSPFQINPNDVYRFAMTSVGAVDMSGFGPYTKSWTDYGSSGLMVYTANNFTCNANTVPPQEQGAWFYADVSGPNSESTLRNNAAAKISAELGVPVNISANMGVVNP